MDGSGPEAVATGVAVAGPTGGAKRQSLSPKNGGAERPIGLTTSNFSQAMRGAAGGAVGLLVVVVTPTVCA